MVIDNDLLDKLAYLCRLELPLHEREAIRHDLNEIVAWMEQLEQFSIDNDRLLESASTLDEYKLRVDEATNTLSHAKAMALAPHSNTHYFIVPSIKPSSLPEEEKV